MCSPYKKIKGKRLLASWKQDYLLKVLSGLSHIEKSRCVCPVNMLSELSLRQFPKPAAPYHPLGNF